MPMAMRLATLAILAAAVATPPAAAEGVTIKAAVLRVDEDAPLPISRLDLAPDDLGFAGARLATRDNQTTGTFLQQTFETVEREADAAGAVAALEAIIAEGIPFVVTIAGPDTTLALADAAGDRALILNAGAPEDRLRNADCRANVVHALPSHAMKADGLAQFLMSKRWSRWFLIEGSYPADTAFADALRAAARKFGAEIVESRVFEDTGGSRESDSGHVLVQRQIPAFTQRAPEHDVVVVADESEVFGAHIPFHTWDARPVSGSAGLRPLSWHPAQESWGATQFQRRFERLAGRTARETDYDVWLALRVIGEAATRTNTGEFAALRDFILGASFDVAGFKGQKLTLRPWDHQLRQPIVLGDDRVLVSVSPQEEYLHQVSQLDTLGTDQPETACTLN